MSRPQKGADQRGLLRRCAASAACQDRGLATTSRSLALALTVHGSKYGGVRDLCRRRWGCRFWNLGSTEAHGGLLGHVVRVEGIVGALHVGLLHSGKLDPSARRHRHSERASARISSVRRTANLFTYLILLADAELVPLEGVSDGQQLFLEHWIVGQAATLLHPVGEPEIHLRALVEVAWIRGLAAEVDFRCITIHRSQRIHHAGSVAAGRVDQRPIRS